MFGMDNHIWLTLILLVVGYSVLLICFNAFMRRWLKVEKRKAFSFNFVNDTHKKIDRTIRVIFMIIFLVSYFLTVAKDPLDDSFVFVPFFILMANFIVTDSIQAIMEWKVAQKKNEAIFTISQMLLSVAFFLSLFYIFI